SVSAWAGSGRHPTDRRCGSDTADIGGADLSSATYGYRLDTFRGGRGGADATPSTWLSCSCDHGVGEEPDWTFSAYDRGFCGATNRPAKGSEIALAPSPQNWT